MFDTMKVVRKRKPVRIPAMRPLNDVLDQSLIIWLPSAPANPNEAAQFRPEVYHGVTDDFNFLVLRYEDTQGVHYQGQAVHEESGSIIMLPTSRCRSVFELAQRKANLFHTQLN